ncbi:MAG: colanic acid biosynthesis glycosyltransferase WcaL [Herpetosiphonaceae bacterium]|nr:MAG: colanic acid biosynthesis glycosyltransferase WcaL [Herpetosiphonaceae bacterium]
MVSVGPQIGYILRSYPRLSQTFILHEILALERLGLRLQLFASVNPREPVVQRQVAEVRAPVRYLDAALRRGRAALVADHLRAAAPRRYLRTLRSLLQAEAIDEGYRAESRFACLHQAVYLARLILQGGGAIRHLHAHFAHDPTLIALLVHRLTGISYSFTAHARDLYQIPVSALIERATAATAVITCCGANRDYLYEVLPPALHEKVSLIHHGVNLQGFQPAERNGASEQTPLILSVGRLVKKKGFADLLEACGRLKQTGRRFRCAIYGDGPLHAELQATIERLGLGDAVMLPGAVPQQELVPIFQQADLFALTPFVTEDGDRDGVPNVLVEAMACGLPVVSAAVAGIPELVQHGYNGLLAAPRDIESFAAHMAALLDDAQRRRQLGAAARRTVVEHFDLQQATRRLSALFSQALGGGYEVSG